MVLDAISHICDPDEFHMVGWYHVYATCKSTNHSKKTVDKVSFYIFEYNCNEKSIFGILIFHSPYEYLLFFSVRTAKSIEEK